MSFPTLGSFKGGGGSTSVTPVVSPLVFRALQVTLTYVFYRKKIFSVSTQRIESVNLLLPLHLPLQYRHGTQVFVNWLKLDPLFMIFGHFCNNKKEIKNMGDSTSLR